MHIHTDLTSYPHGSTSIFTQTQRHIHIAQILYPQYTHTYRKHRPKSISTQAQPHIHVNMIINSHYLSNYKNYLFKNLTANIVDMLVSDKILVSVLLYILQGWLEVFLKFKQLYLHYKYHMKNNNNEQATTTTQ